MHYKALNDIIYGILDSIKDSLPTDRYESNREYVFVGEPGIAFENICAYIDDNEIQILRETYEKIVAAGRAMEMDSGEWTFLEKHIVAN